MPNSNKDQSLNKKTWTIILFFSFYIFLALISRLFLNNQRQITNSSAAGPLTSVTFQPSGDEFPNPERGFMRQSNIFVDQPYDPSKLGKKDPNDTVDWVYFHLEGYRDPRDGRGVTVSNYQFIPLQPVGSGRGLDTVKKTFDDARAKGLKLVIRFLYLGYSGIGSTSDFANAEPDAPLNIALAHIDQLAPLMQQNKDVIAAVQAGFVGYWGEWHSSKYLSPLANRKAIVDKLLTAVPPDRMINVRYPKYVQNFYGGPIPDSQAFNQSTLSRVGFHDDAAFKDTAHDGTFTSNAMGMTISNYCSTVQCWQDYYSQTSKYTPSGGEAGTHSSTASTEADCSQAVPMLNKLHFSYLHNGYSMITLNHWVSQGCMPEIRKRLGYRFQLNRLSLSQSVQPGTSLEFHLELENKGFASPYNPRPAILVLKNNSSGFQKEIPLTSVDVRRWLTGQIIKVDLNIPIPQDVPNGNYSVFLWLPDASASLKTRPEYSVRFANLNVWQAGSGQNLIFNNLVVSGTPVTPGPITNTPTQSIHSPTPTRTPTVVILSPTRTPTRSPTPILSPTRTLTPTRTPTVGPLAAGLRFKIAVPDVAASVNNIPFAAVQVEIYDGTTRVMEIGANLVRSGNYFQTPTDFFVNIQQNKTYTISLKIKTTLRKKFLGVFLTQSQTLDCTVGSSQACGELITQRDIKTLSSGDSDGFNSTSGSFNKIDSADLQVLGMQFNTQASVSQPSSDFNLDGQVNILDLETLGKNYGKIGD